MNNRKRHQPQGEQHVAARIPEITHCTGRRPRAARDCARQAGTEHLENFAALACRRFQYHHGETLWPQLVREPDNHFDDRAVHMEWQGYKLGCIPRLDNAAVSQLLDRGERLEAVIAGLQNSSNPWVRLMVEVRWLT